MCMAVPGLISEINGEVATVSYNGELKKCKLLIKADKGDYVIAQSGMIVKKIEKSEAYKIFEAME
ncbi:MAG: HypC/HybG/HupF family hydrogenase formation chaperone [Candidatus Nanoarchaeia archaeon]|nr:HypC/HybG/HupF family hydrogenase formation chaperone [Candidatus Nanoarchaeia archaeon]